MSELLEKIKKLTSADDVEGITSLLESWPHRDDEWEQMLNARICASSTSRNQKKRLKIVEKSWRLSMKKGGGDLSQVKTSLDIIRKLIELENSGANFETEEIKSWLGSIEKIECTLSKLVNLRSLSLVRIKPKGQKLSGSFATLEKLEELILVDSHFKKLPDGISDLKQLHFLNVSGNKLTNLPSLPSSLEILRIDKNPLTGCDLSSLVNLKELSLDGVHIAPEGIEYLQSLESLSWKGSKLRDPPDSFAKIPKPDIFENDGSVFSYPAFKKSGPSVLEKINQKYLVVEEAITQFEQIDEPSLERDLLSLIKRQNEEIEKEKRAYYDYRKKLNPKDIESTFDSFIVDMPDIFITIGSPATTESIQNLQNIMGRDLPRDLVQFYQIFGRISGTFEQWKFHLFIPGVDELLRDFTTAKNCENLHGIGLLDMINWSWGNDKEELTVEGGLPQDEFDQYNSYLCVGWFGGDAEDHEYIIEISPNKFGVFYWHQDDYIELPDPAKIKTYSLLELVLKVSNSCKKKRQAAIAESRQHHEGNDDDFDENKIDFDFDVDTALNGESC